MLSFEYLDWPKVPDNIINDVIYSSKSYPDCTPRNEAYAATTAIIGDSPDYAPNHPRPVYSMHNCTQKVKEFIQTFIGDGYEVRVQQMRSHGPHPIHVDYGRTEAFNYIIDTGGDQVYTKYYDQDLTNTEQYQIEPLRWHRIRVDTLHNVVGIAPGRTRLAITIYKPT